SIPVTRSLPSTASQASPRLIGSLQVAPRSRARAGQHRAAVATTDSSLQVFPEHHSAATASQAARHSFPTPHKIVRGEQMAPQIHVAFRVGAEQVRLLLEHILHSPPVAVAQRELM